MGVPVSHVMALPPPSGETSSAGMKRRLLVFASSQAALGDCGPGGTELPEIVGSPAEPLGAMHAPSRAAKPSASSGAGAYQRCAGLWPVESKGGRQEGVRSNIVIVLRCRHLFADHSYLASGPSEYNRRHDHEHVGAFRDYSLHG